ncbi:hypothetical protein NJH78_18570 [Pseudomonas chlororaphis]|uniref:hypothetical protein n=1 Tax=Pseudomonas chlororaphis TaxID=587753 RepID=UPI00209A986F|nr:hypothetical protein [Pseudomonas chlororaphis]MCO7571992.1 hypothetical protein [Pseudomonas chlororaphis]MCO7589772.1 hypothetical protein [Pseudomonas chlororaphis]
MTRQRMLYTRILWATLGAILATAVWLMTTGGRLPTVSSSHDQALSSSDAIAPAADCVDLSPSSSAVTNDPCVPGPVLLPGMQVNRQVGPVMFVLVVDSNEARVNAQVSLGNAALTGLNMTAAAPTADFNLANGDGQRVWGSLGAFFCAPPNTSHLLADFTIENLRDSGKSVTQAYRGDLIRWQSPTTSVLARYRQPLLPDLQVTVELLDPYKADSSNALTAQVSFYYASDLIDRYTLMATATPVSLRQSSVGPVRIEGGLLDFRPATQEQQGQLSLDGTFQSGHNPPNHYVGSVADWSWIRGRADNCRG